MHPVSAPHPQHKDQIFKGIGFGLAAFFLFAAMSAAAKLLTDTHSVFEIAFYRSLIAAVPFAGFILLSKRYDLLVVKKRGALAFRIVIGIVGLVFTFSAMKHLPIADATLIFLTATLITPMMALIILKEKMGRRRWLAIIFGLCGVALLVGPTGQGAMIGIIFGFAAAFCHSSTQVVLRILKQENSLTITFYFLIGGSLLMAPFMPFVASPFENAQELWLMATVGATGAIAQICLSLAFKYAPANSISPFNFSGILWATLFDILIWSYIPGWPVFLGAAMMLMAKLYILNRERIHARNAKHNA